MTLIEIAIAMLHKHGYTHVKVVEGKKYSLNMATWEITIPSDHTYPTIYRLAAVAHEIGHIAVFHAGLPQPGSPFYIKEEDERLAWIYARKLFPELASKPEFKEVQVNALNTYMQRSVYLIEDANKTLDYLLN